MKGSQLGRKIARVILGSTATEALALLLYIARAYMSSAVVSSIAWAILLYGLVIALDALKECRESSEEKGDHK